MYIAQKLNQLKYWSQNLNWSQIEDNELKLYWLITKN